MLYRLFCLRRRHNLLVPEICATIPKLFFLYLDTVCEMCLKIYIYMYIYIFSYIDLIFKKVPK